jgi:hypothetical protein
LMSSHAVALLYAAGDELRTQVPPSVSSHRFATSAIDGIVLEPMNTLTPCPAATAGQSRSARTASASARIAYVTSMTMMPVLSQVIWNVPAVVLTVPPKSTRPISGDVEPVPVDL